MADAPFWVLFRRFFQVGINIRPTKHGVGGMGGGRVGGGEGGGEGGG